MIATAAGEIWDAVVRSNSEPLFVSGPQPLAPAISRLTPCNRNRVKGCSASRTYDSSD